MFYYHFLRSKSCDQDDIDKITSKDLKTSYLDNLLLQLIQDKKS